MKHKNRFRDGEVVLLLETGTPVTIDRWSYEPNMKRYTYSIVEEPSTFLFEEELVPVE